MTTSSQVHKPTSKQFTHKFVNFLGSKKFFGIVAGLLVFQAAWIALTARYPQAFDEQFHFGLIQLHAQQLSPFFTHQPAGADAFGAASRDPSYLYHYLLSFPYRLIAHMTHDLTIQIITLRFINIGLMVAALFIFRRVLGFTKASKALVQTSLFFFVITPVVPLLASQINYDNMLIPAVGWAVLWCLRLLKELHEKRVWRWDIALELLIICLLGSIVKYAFLPVFAAIVLVVFFAWKSARKKLQKQPDNRLSTLRLVACGVLVLISAGLFMERYAVNTLRYHTPTPECNQVLSIAECEAYGPWARNYNAEQQKTKLSITQETTYPFVWIYHSIAELVFTIGSGYNSRGTIDYYVGIQLPIPEVLAWTFLGTGIITTIAYWRWFWQNVAFRVFALVCAVYILALMGQNWADYLHLGKLVAIHGRYLLPILPFFYIVVAMGLHKASEHLRGSKVFSAQRVRVGLVVVVMLLMTQGGGITAYIVRSKPWWFWPQIHNAQVINADAQQLLKPHILGTTSNDSGY